MHCICLAVYHKWHPRINLEVRHLAGNVLLVFKPCRSGVCVHVLAVWWFFLISRLEQQRRRNAGQGFQSSSVSLTDWLSCPFWPTTSKRGHFEWAQTNLHVVVAGGCLAKWGLSFTQVVLVCCHCRSCTVPSVSQCLLAKTSLTCPFAPATVYW